jgi:putative membrane protein
MRGHRPRLQHIELTLCKSGVREGDEMKLILNWILSAVALLIVSHVVGGFYVTSFTAALIAAFVIGFANATLGLFLKVITFPLTLVTFGIFWFVINAIMLELAASFVPGFRITGFTPAFIGAIALSLVNLIFKAFTKAMTSDR